MTTVTFLWTSKSKYGIKYDEAGSIVEEKLHDSGIKIEKKKNNKYQQSTEKNPINITVFLIKISLFGNLIKSLMNI